MSIAENITNVEDASKVIAHILRELAKSEAMKSKQDTDDDGTTILVDTPSVLEPTTPFINNPDYVFESDLHYGSYQGIHHGSVIDPYGIMAMLGFLVFLFYLIYNYLNATGSANNGRKFLLFNSFYNSDAEEKIHLTNRIWNSLMMEINKKSL